MTDLPAGLDLDRAVAEAMGWHSFGVERRPQRQTAGGELVPEHDRHYGAPPGALPGTRVSIPTYSTTFGPWTQEMIDWLGDRIAEVFPEGTQWKARIFGANLAGRGATIPEALARIVVAVREKEQQTHE